MISLWREAIQANDVGALTAVAEKIGQYYRGLSPNSKRRIHLEQLGNWIGVDLYSFALMTILGEKVEAPSFGRLLELVLCVIMMGEEDSMGMQMRLACSGVIWIFPVNSMIVNALKYAHVPEQSMEMARMVVFASLELAMNEITFEHKEASLFPSALQFGSTIGFMMLSKRAFGYATQKGCPKIIALAGLMGLSHLVGKAIARVSGQGLRGCAEWIVGKVMSRLMKKDREDLPLDADTPPELECHICHELLSDPVDLMGSFFCRECITRWMRRSPIHPYTGEYIGLMVINESPVMSYVVNKFHAIYLRDHVH